MILALVACPAVGHIQTQCGRMPVSDEDTKAELERLRAENAALKKASEKGLTLKVSEKGAVSVYGLGRFPVTLSKEQWLRLLEMSEDIRRFIEEHADRLKTKE